MVQFFDAIAELCAPYPDQAKIGVLKVDVAIALLERDFPLSLQVKAWVTCMINAACYGTYQSWKGLIYKGFIIPHLFHSKLRYKYTYHILFSSIFLSNSVIEKYNKYNNYEAMYCI